MKDQVMRDFRERWQAVADIEAEERRSASIDLRWRQTNAILRMAIGLGLSLEEVNEPKQMIYDRWSQLRGI